MKRGLLLIVGLTAAWSMQAQDPQPTDEGIKRLIARSNRYRHGEGERSLLYARSLCGDDTNRFARLLYEVAQTNDARLAGLTIRLLGEYGTPSQLPFLYSQVSNTEYGVDAVQSILKLEGITSNSVAMVDGYLSNTNVDFEYRAQACECFLQASALPAVSGTMRQSARSVALNYALHANRYVRGTDKAFIAVDPTYQYSKRRLSVLRSANALGVSSYQVDYVTNAINELVAYPESELPE